MDPIDDMNAAKDSGVSHNTVDQCICVQHPLTKQLMEGSPYKCITQNADLQEAILDALKGNHEEGESSLAGIDETEEEDSKFFYEKALKRTQDWCLEKCKFECEDLPSCVMPKLMEDYGYNVGTCSVCTEESCCCTAHPLTKDHLGDTMDCITQHEKLPYVYGEVAVKANLVRDGKDFPDSTKSDSTKRKFFRKAAKKLVIGFFKPKHQGIKRRPTDSLPCCLNRTLKEEYHGFSSDDEEQKNGVFMVIYQTKNRIGTMVDVKKLERISKDLGYRFYPVPNQTSQGIKEAFEKQLKRARNTHQCFICVILSHGDANNVLVDSENKLYNLEDLTSVVKKYSSLDGLPILFFVQACRGTETTPNLVSDPGQKDLLLCFATIHGGKAYRTELNGSYFIQCLDEGLKNKNGSEIMQVVAYINQKLPLLKDNCTPSCSTWLTKEVRLKLANKTEMETIDVYRSNQKEKLFLIIAELDKHQDDINNLKSIAICWGFKEDEIKIWENHLNPAGSGTSQGDPSDRSRNNAFVNKVGKWVIDSDFEATRCFVCAVVSEHVKPATFQLTHKDESFDLGELEHVFRGTLLERPKLFFVQKYPQPNQKKGEAADSVGTLHPAADTMVTYSSAGKGQDGGSAFFETLLSVTRETPGDQRYLSQILTNVRAQMDKLKEPLPWTRTQLRYEVQIPLPPYENTQQPDADVDEHSS